MAAPVVPILDVTDYDQQIQRSARTLQQGGLVVLPTETVYGVAASLRQAGALDRLRKLSPPAPSKPLVVHLARPEDAARYVGPLGEVGQRMIRKLWPGPVALVFDVP